MNDKLQKFIEELPVGDNIEFLYCPYCNEKLMYLEPGNTLYCRTCDKHFKNDNNTVGEEIENPASNENVLY